MADSDKAKSKSVSFPPGLWEKVETKAAKRYGANRSAYLRVLVEADLESDGLPVRSDDTGSEMARLAELCHESGIDPVLFFRSVMLKVLQYAKENGDRLILPIRIESPNSELQKGANVLNHLDAETRNDLIDRANRGESWATVAEQLVGSFDAGRFSDLRLAYAFLASPFHNYPTPREQTLIAAEEPSDPLPAPKRVPAKRPKLAPRDETKAG